MTDLTDHINAVLAELPTEATEARKQLEAMLLKTERYPVLEVMNAWFDSGLTTNAFEWLAANPDQCRKLLPKLSEEEIEREARRICLAVSALQFRAGWRAPYYRQKCAEFAIRRFANGEG